MASSQVEMASSSPFGCVLRDHNSRRERRRDTNHQNPNPKSQSNFQRNLKELVRDHLHSCISISPRGSNSEHDENSQGGSNFSCFRGSGNSSGKSSSIHNNNINNQQQRNNNNNRWAAQKAKEMMTTIESLSSPKSKSQSSSIREPSPTPSNCSSNDFSVSSLVQKWRGFEAEAKHTQPINNNNNNNNNNSINSNNANANVNVNVNVNVDIDTEMMSRPNSAGSTCESTITVEDRDEGGEQREVVVEERETVAMSTMDGGEKERIRVADIVKKWACDEATGSSTNTNNNNNNNNHEELQQQQQQLPFGASLTRLRIGKDLSHSVVCSPRLRGRQAIADLYMRMERERYKEVELIAARQAVSKFPQRGRIQSLLRLRFLRREVSVQDHRQPAPPSRGPQTASAITSLRERFSTTSEQDSTTVRSPRRDTATSNQDTRSPRMDTPTSNRDTEPCISNQPSKQAICQEDFNIRSSHIETRNNADAGTPSTPYQELEQPTNMFQEDFNFQSSHIETRNNTDAGTPSMPYQELEQPTNMFHKDFNFRSSHVEIRKNTDAGTPSTSCQESEQPTNMFQEARNTLQQNSLTQAMEVLQQEIPSLEAIWQETSYEEVDNFETPGALDSARSYSGWDDEEEEMFYEDQDGSSQQFFESNLDWISDIARPRSYWEDCRQARYQEVFNTRSQDEEIRQLLERGSVSAVLASDFPDRMDRLMMCSVQRAMHSSANEEEEDNQSMRDFLQLHISSFNHQSEDEQHSQEHVQENREDIGQEDREEDEEGIEVREEEEEVTSGINQYHGGGDYYDQTPSSSQMPWDQHYQDREASYDSDHAASTSLQPPSLVPSYDHDTREGSSLKNSSIEMELIYDLRAHMEQMYRDMSELRKSITSCVDMQMKLQHSIKEEVSAAINHTDRVERKDSNRRQPKKGSCCICYEKKVDSLLYRCGHMCTCFNCAHELQWSSGKCPICRAQILDVVRAYPDI